MPDNDVHATDLADTGFEMPALFTGHGNPMNAIEDTEFSRTWSSIGRSLPRPAAILCISAHWETVGTRVTAMERPRTIHDFGGFPKPLFDVEYPAPGHPGLARLIQKILDTAVSLDFDWGIDCLAVVRAANGADVRRGASSAGRIAGARRSNGVAGWPARRFAKPLRFGHARGRGHAAGRHVSPAGSDFPCRAAVGAVAQTWGDGLLVGTGLGHRSSPNADAIKRLFPRTP